MAIAHALALCHSQSYIFAACFAAILAGWGAKATNRYKWIGILGVIVHFAGVWLMMRTRGLNSSTFELVLSQLLGGVGGGFTTIAAQLGCQSVVNHQGGYLLARLEDCAAIDGVPRTDVAIATAIFLTITQIGGAVGGAGAGAVWSTYLPLRLHEHFPQDDESQALIPQIMASLPFAMSFPMDSPIRIAINESYRDVQRVLNVIALAALVPAFVAVCCMRNVNLAKEDMGVAGVEGPVVILGRASPDPDEDEDALADADGEGLEDGERETSALLGGVPQVAAGASGIAPGSSSSRPRDDET